MWKRPSLRARILMMLSLLVFITVGGCLVSIWHAYMMEKSFTEVVDVDIPALAASQELRTSLVMQKGYVTYYFQDSDPQWLEELEKHNRDFREWLKKAWGLADTPPERETLHEIDAEYVRYAQARSEVLRLYGEGKREDGLRLHSEARGQLFRIIDLCRRYQQVNEQSLEDVRRRNRERVKAVNQMALIALGAALLLGAVLAYTLTRQVLEPIHRLARGSDGSTASPEIQDDVRALALRFQNLMKDVEQTKSKLEWSRAHLEQAEKWALVGKLAAGVAHSVRNPLTSVKMRLFSMERTLRMDSSQKEDFEVISEEIRHIDSIVNNFLEFSRPPKLKMRVCSPSGAVDTAIQLLRHRLESYGVKVELQREKPLPDITADPDQLKEVLVNLMVNACDAMVQGGTIWIDESAGVAENGESVVIIKVRDNGPGVSESVQAKIFQPFFSTKGEGTGLGLSIAMRIVEEHGGWLDFKSEKGYGATFIITLPAGEEESWVRSL
jgi:signal transduction histidine kinase